MYSISDKAYVEQSAFKTIKSFYKEFKVGSALKNAGAYKSKGIPVMNILLYLIFLVYAGKTMNREASGRNSAIGCSKDAVYRFLRNQRTNWGAFLITVARNVISFIVPLTACTRKNCLVIDDTLYERACSRKTELLSNVYDYQEKRYTRGFRTLFLAWTDGASLVPLCFRHMTATNEKKRCVPEREGLDKRTRSYKSKKEAKMKSTDLCLSLLETVKKSCIPADYVLFDSWFAFPSVISRIKELGYDVIARVKKMPKVYYYTEEKQRTLKQIFDQSKKRRGKSRYLLSVDAHILNSEGGQVPCRLVFVRKKGNRKDWIAIITTDMSLPPEEVIANYGKRWSIEVFFKTCKTYLKFTGEFQQLSYEAVTAHTVIVALRYMMLSVQQRRQTDYKALGKLFYETTDDAHEMTFHEVLAIIMTELMNALTKEFYILDEASVRNFMESFIRGLQPRIQWLLAPDFYTKNPVF